MKCFLKILAAAALLLQASSIYAWMPEGWIYIAWPFGYSASEENFYYFNQDDTLHVYAHCTGCDVGPRFFCRAG